MSNTSIDRRKFLEVAGTGALAFTIVPRHVLGGRGFVAPSDKITLAYIGCGTQGLRELLPMLTIPEIQVVAICDPNLNAAGYKDWSPNGLRDAIRATIKKPDWTSGGDNTIPGGRANGKSIVDNYYGNNNCAAHIDPRELLENQRDLDAVKIMTPDHLHGTLAMMALKKGKHVLMHKPLSNRLHEGWDVVQAAGAGDRVTHLIPWDSNGSMDQVMQWINEGQIGTLTEVHNWTNRPVWPQYNSIPEAVPVPDGLDWDLWLGPEAERPYSPHYTNMVFRGWYDFGGGSMADMGHYSLWSVMDALQLEGPVAVEPCYSHYVGMGATGPDFAFNDFAFPWASTVRFHYPAKGNRPNVALCWYDGGIRPPIPQEIIGKEELPTEGMMFVGEKGKILAGFNTQNPRLLSPYTPPIPQGPDPDRIPGALKVFADACKSGKQYAGSFRDAWAITEAVNLYAVALRSGKFLRYDPDSRQITNVPDANKYLSRAYRPGWDPTSA